MDFSRIKKLTAAEVLKDEEIKAAFIKLSSPTHYEQQIRFFKQAAMDNPEIMQAAPLSVYAALMDIAFTGLSIENVPKAQAYIVPQPHNVGTPQNKVYEKRVQLRVSGYGELYLRQRSGVIKYADNPVIAYEGDQISYVDGVVKHTAQIPRDPKAKMLGGYIRITRPDGTIDTKYFDISEIMALKKASKTQGSAHWNGANGDPTTGMMDAKIIKHAFRAYPRIKAGAMAVIVNDIEETEYLDAMKEVVDQMQDQSTPLQEKPQVQVTLVSQELF